MNIFQIPRPSNEIKILNTNCTKFLDNFHTLWENFLISEANLNKNGGNLHDFLKKLSKSKRN